MRDAQPQTLADADAERHLHTLLHSEASGGSEGDVAALRAAYHLGRTAAPKRWVPRLLDELEAAAGREDVSAELWLSNALAAFGAAAGREVRRRAEGDELSPHYRTLLLDVLMDLGGSPNRSADLDLFARCLSSEHPWLRYAGLVGLEQAGSSAASHAEAIVPVVLGDEKPFVTFTAISALFYSVRLHSSSLCHPLLYRLVFPGSRAARVRGRA